MEFKKSTRYVCFVRNIEKSIKKIKIEFPGSYYPGFVKINDEIDLSKLRINECINVIAVDNINSFEKKVLINIYKRIK